MKDRARSRLRLAASLWVLVVACSCAPARLAVRPSNYDVDVRLQPSEHAIEARVAIDLEPLDAFPGSERRSIELLLHPELDVTSVEVEGATLRAHDRRGGEIEDGGVSEPAKHRLILEQPTGPLRVTLVYAGRLNQDVDAGEEQGEIHNLTMSAHVSPEGLYLEPSGYWYPGVDLPEDSDPALTLAGYRLAVVPIDEFELVAGVESAATEIDGKLRWSSPFPLEGLVLLGGPLERTSGHHEDIELHAVLAPGKGSVGEDILAASAEYLDRYQELIGPYPFSEFTVLEAFFSSGFAFPTCTQIAGSQLSEYRQYRRHGYLDHELLHNWYGNGILVDPGDGNWCEGLSSYLGNYYGFVLDGDEAGARKQRRNQSNFLSAIEPEDDKPLGTFGLDDGAGRGIGYQKSASVFHMLERRIGSDAFFGALRRLTAERMGKFSTWEHLREVFERESGEDLGSFFDQWVRGAGAPLLALESADYRPGRGSVAVTVSQGETDFDLDLPLRLHYEDRTEDVTVRLTEPVETLEVPCDPQGLTAVELDPDYHLFRRLKTDEIMPTYNVTRRSETLLIVVPEGELRDGYRVLIDANRPDEDDDAREVEVREIGEIGSDDLAATSVLILGEAVHDPRVGELLARTRSPVAWNDAGFGIGGDRYDGERQAVFLTVHHPDLPGEGITVYYGNSADALSNATVLGFYANSLLVFDTPEEVSGVEAGDAMPRAEVIRRMDFEFHERIDF